MAAIISSQETDAESTQSSRSNSEDEDIEERGDSGRDAGVSSSKSNICKLAASVESTNEIRTVVQLRGDGRVAQNLTHDGRCNEMSTI